METPKPFEALAMRYNISNETAKYFLGQVQKSFKTEKPPQQLILDFIKRRKFKELPKPHQLATKMSESGIWTHALHAEPPALQDEPDIYK